MITASDCLPAGSFHAPSLLEQSRDKLDLKPSLDFVESHQPEYIRGIRRLTGSKRPSAFAEAWAENVRVPCEESIVGPHIMGYEVAGILCHLPASLMTLSALAEVRYDLAGIVPVPKFDENGRFTGGADAVPLAEFPRTGDHPTAILIGWTSNDGTMIRPTAIPKTVTADTIVGWFYQVHVLLHEFMHTVLAPFDTAESRSLVKLRKDTFHFTLEKWWNYWRALFLSQTEPQFVTRYASLYEQDLTDEVARHDLPRFDRALTEQVCECFAAYMLGIAPNDTGWTEFHTERFGSGRTEPVGFDRDERPYWNGKAHFISVLCEATAEPS